MADAKATNRLTAFVGNDEMAAVELLFRLRASGTPSHENIHAQAAARALADFYTRTEGPCINPCLVVRQVAPAPSIHHRATAYIERA